MRQRFRHDGRAISYLEAVRPGRTQPKTLVLLHAFPLSAEMWQPQLDAVPEGWRFVAPDLRGFGGSGLEVSTTADSDASRVSFDDYASDVVALLDELEVEQAVVGGLSMGGYAAFALLRLAPERVRALVLADTKVEADGEAARQARDGMLAVLQSGGAEAVWARMEAGLLGVTTRRTNVAVVDRVHQLVAAQSPSAIGRAIRRLKGRPDSSATLAAFDRPVLCLAGEEDELTPPGLVSQMAGENARRPFVVVPRAGHLSNLEQPNAFNAALGAFLAQR